MREGIDNGEALMMEGSGGMSDPKKVMEMLDFMTEAGVSRIRVETSEAVEEGTYQKAYHHGRCDVGSPFATGKLYDLEDPEEESDIR